MNFNGKTAIVTGAGRGLGLTYAQTLAALGANVVISDLCTDRAVREAIAAWHLMPQASYSYRVKMSLLIAAICLKNRHVAS